MARNLPMMERSGTVGWSCPSNIALIKYWGKKPGQFPMNPSLSLTLQEARTTTTMHYSYAPGKTGRSFRFRFEGKEAPAFAERIGKYLETLEAQLPLLSRTDLDIESWNSFPHSSGIASSASAMAALALCLVELEAQVSGSMSSERFWQNASRLARLGSGSASRSVYPQFALWGQSSLWEGSSDEFAIPVKDFHGTFLNLRDSILVVESKPKKISSSAGHALMLNHPFRKVRLQQAGGNLELLHSALVKGDWQEFLRVIEEEALTLHAMMMTSRPGYLLMQPATLSILQLIREYREETGCRLGFTLDAGANVHLLHADADTGQVEEFIRSELLRFCEDGRVIRDKMGQGPLKYRR